VLISQNKIVERQNQLISFEQTSNFRELLFQPPFDSLGNTLNIFEGRPGLIKNWPQPNSSNVYQLSQFGKIEPETVLPALRTLLGDRHTSISSSALLSLYELAIQYDLGGLDFRGTNLHKSTLNNAVLQGANLSYASISGSNLTSTFLNFVIFDYADLSLSNLSNSEIAKSSFEFTDLSYANLNSVTVFNDIKTMAGANIIYG